MKKFHHDDLTATDASQGPCEPADRDRAALASPSDNTDDETIPLRSAEEALHHPLFPEVRAALNRGTLDLYTTQNFPGGFAVDAWRVILLGQIMGLDGDDIEGGTAATPTELKQRMATYGLYSARQIDAYLSRLIQTGHLEVVVHPRDRRVRLLRPLPPLVYWHWCFVKLYCDACHALFPKENFDLILRREDKFLPFVARIGAGKIAMATAMELLMRDPDLAAFFGRGGATLVLHAAMHETSADPTRPLRESDLVSYAEMFGRSRSHMRNLIALAIEKGFFEEVGRRPQTLRVTPRLIETLSRYLADTIRSSERTYRRAERAYGESSAPR
ncbi:hypothetical protein [Aureimonas ureilytica]|uniref:hypothetical protein n=1 Tax=Aureimonas ureilytica TaxID=401562 RepID=UPI0007344186|nr:hypothetical protein [Aureimonas ureilytica]